MGEGGQGDEGTPGDEGQHEGLRIPAVSAKDLKDRTLTNLYNAVVAWRAQGGQARDMPKGVKIAAWEFAPRMVALHDELDRAVCAAYGWDASVLDDEEAILRHLLALNLQRAGVSSGG